MAKHIVCFGDSNTWGYDGRDCSRFDENTRWTALLQRELGLDYRVIEEGQNGRTIWMQDPCEGEKCGADYILPCLESHKPLDLLILMLGTNDLKARFHLSARNIAHEMEAMLRKILGYTRYDPLLSSMKILLVSPIHLGEGILSNEEGPNFGGQTGLENSRNLAQFYREAAEKFGCDFLDAASVTEAAPPDYVHMGAENHRAFAQAILPVVRRCLD